MRRLLEYQAERIEMVLASHKVPSHVYRGTVTPRFVRFELVPIVGTKVSRVKGLARRSLSPWASLRAECSARGGR